MHIPDGFLSLPVALTGWVAAAVLLGLSLRYGQRDLGERQVPLVGLLAAFIFAAQAINFPVAAGTSGHLLGGALAAILVGPWNACLVMACVIGVQGLLFQDGGLLAMGWNVLNMGSLTAFTGFFAFRAGCRLVRNNPAGRLASAFAAAWLSVQVGAVATALELAASGTSPLGVALPAMLAVHALIGLGEGLITLSAVSFLQVARPALLEQGRRSSGQSSAGLVLAGLSLSLIVALCSPLASPSPDGLDSVATRAGFASRSVPPLYKIFPEYTLPFLKNPALATMAAVSLGTLIVFALGYGVARLSLRTPRERLSG